MIDIRANVMGGSSNGRQLAEEPRETDVLPTLPLRCHCGEGMYTGTKRPETGQKHHLETSDDTECRDITDLRASFVLLFHLLRG